MSRQQLIPGLLVKKDPDEYDMFLVVKYKREVLLRNILTGEELFPEGISYEIVGKKRSDKILVSLMNWGCREEFPMEDLKDLLKGRSDCRKKTYVSFPNDGSDSYTAVFTSRPVTDSEAYYLVLQYRGDLFDG
jgi:hypothetical protein